MRRLIPGILCANKRSRKHPGERVNGVLLLALTAVALAIGMSLPSRSQQPSSSTKSVTEELPASCSILVTREKDQITVKCQGMSTEQGEKVSAAALSILPVMNKLLENKLDPEVVTAKLDELAKTASRVPQVKTYFCDGMWQSGVPNSGKLLDTKTGGNDSEFLNMISLLEKKQYPDLLSKCTANIKSSPGWLTPNLLCGLAYAHLNRKVEAQTMLTEFEEKTGPTYDVPDCHDMHDLLRRLLSK
jgi:hypothetical protein